MDKNIKIVFDTPQRLKVIKFFLNGDYNYDYTIMDIARGSGVSPITLKKIIPLFVELEILTHTRNIANARLYKLNNETNIVRAIKRHVRSYG